MDSLLVNTPRDHKEQQPEEMKSPQVKELEKESEENLKTLIKEGLKIGELEGNDSEQETNDGGSSSPFKQKAIILQKYEEFKQKEEEI